MATRISSQSLRADRALVERVLQRFMHHLRVILKRNAPAVIATFPDCRRPCHTCAFNQSTDRWKGWDSTAYGLMRAIAADQPFYCHEPFNRTKKTHGDWIYDPAKAYLCAGYAMVIRDPEAKLAFTRAAIEEQAPDIAASSIPEAF